MSTKFVKESEKTATKQAQNEKMNKIYKAMNTKHGIIIYGYIRQNFERKCLIQEIIAIIFQFFKDGGCLYVCGNGKHGNLGIGEFYNNECIELTHVHTVKKIVDVATCYGHTMLVDYNGRIWAFGKGEDGRLGNGNTNNFTVPKKINLDQRATAVRVGQDHSLILIENGNVLSCGLNDWGQLGHGDTERQGVPKIIEALKEHKITQISAGSVHNGAVSEKGDLFMWGNNEVGQCGVGKRKKRKITTPKKVKLRGRVSVIECGNYHSLLITMKKLLYSFGHEMFDQLGHSLSAFEIISLETNCCRSSIQPNVYFPKWVRSLRYHSIISVAGGSDHTLCVDDKFNVWAFGSNEFGQCGLSKNIQRQPVPKKIEYFTTNMIKAKRVAAGYGISCVITVNNECFVFGNNRNNQIGLEEKIDHISPTRLPLSVQKVSMGYGSSTFISDYLNE